MCKTPSSLRSLFEIPEVASSGGCCLDDQRIFFITHVLWRFKAHEFYFASQNWPNSIRQQLFELNDELEANNPTNRATRCHKTSKSYPDINQYKSDYYYYTKVHLEHKIYADDFE